MNVQHIRVARKHMNSTFDFVISAPRDRALAAQTLLHQAHDAVGQLEDTLSEFRPLTPVARLNAAAPGERVALPPDVIALLEISRALQTQTEGAFDIAVKGARAVAPAVSWDRETGTGWRNGPEERISFAAIGKGYALEKVRSLIAQEGFQDFHLNAGGSSLIFSGFSAPHAPWRWGWGWRKDDEGNWMGLEFDHVSGEPIAIGVSGTAEQGFHLVDPRTRTPVRVAQTALVALSSATEADALSTALFVHGWENGAPKLMARPEIPALAMIDPTETPTWNGRFQKLWGALGAAVLTLLLPLWAYADDAVDLADLGFEDFTPYEIHRDPLWMLLPAASLALVILHLKKNNRRKRSEKVET